MSINIQMINRERRTGKTSELKLRLHEDLCFYDYVLFLGHNSCNSNMLYSYARKYTNKSRRELGDLRGIRDSKILVLIDEPFIMPSSLQQNLLRDLHSLADRNSIEVIGIGSLECGLFTAYIGEYK